MKTVVTDGIRVNVIDMAAYREVQDALNATLEYISDEARAKMIERNKAEFRGH